MKIKESTVLLDVRRIKEEMARAAEADPEFYQRLNGQGSKLLSRYRKSSVKSKLSEDESAKPAPATSSAASASATTAPPTSSTISRKSES